MPEVVLSFSESQNWQEAREIQLEILNSYDRDFSKHAPQEIVPRIRQLWQSIPAQLSRENRKFIYGLVREGARAREYEIAFPAKSNKPAPTIKDAIGKYPALESGESSDILNHEAMVHSQQMIEKMSYVKDGGGRDDIPEEIRPQKGDIRKYIRYDSTKPSICITGDMRKVFHYSQNRALTVRELAAIQTYPDSFEFLGSKILQQQMVGNSVPPFLAKAIADAVKTML